MAWFDKKNGNLKGLENEIDSLLEEMAVTDRESEEYRRMSESLEKIGKAKSYEKTSDPIDWNEILVNMTGILIPIVLIMNYEKLDVVATKAFGLVRKVH